MIASIFWFYSCPSATIHLSVTLYLTNKMLGARTWRGQTRYKAGAGSCWTNDELLPHPRRSKKQRVDIFNELLVKGFKGDAISHVTRAWEKSKRFSVVRLAKVSDMDSSFNPTAVGATRACEGGLGKREMGLLCGASSMRRRQAKVHELAISLGWSWLPGEPTSAGIGELGWMWGCDDQGPFERGVHLYVKLVYYDTMMMVGKEDPWIVALTGDA